MFGIWNFHRRWRDGGFDRYLLKVEMWKCWIADRWFGYLEIRVCPTLLPTAYRLLPPSTPRLRRTRTPNYHEVSFLTLKWACLYFRVLYFMAAYWRLPTAYWNYSCICVFRDGLRLHWSYNPTILYPRILLSNKNPKKTTVFLNHLL
jgi:hypothetical protein